MERMMHWEDLKKLINILVDMQESRLVWWNVVVANAFHNAIL